MTEGKIPEWIGKNEYVEPAHVPYKPLRPTNEQAHAAGVCIEEVVQVLKKHGFCMGNEDTHGGFLLFLREDVDVNHYDAWVRHARLVLP